MGIFKGSDKYRKTLQVNMVEKGKNREDAYTIVQSLAHLAWNQPEGNFHQLVSQDPGIAEILSSEEIENCFDHKHHLRHLDEVYQRLSI